MKSWLVEQNDITNIVKVKQNLIIVVKRALENISVSRTHAMTDGLLVIRIGKIKEQLA